MPRIFRTFPLLAVLSVACESSSPGSEGELGQERFFYVCTESSDGQCATEQLGLPEALAVGGSFRLDTSSGGFGSASIRAASSQLVSTSGAGFEFLQAGVAGFLAFDGAGALSDFTHLSAVDADTLRVFGSDRQEVTALALTAGETVTLTANPFRDATALAGGFAYAWSSSDSRILQVPAHATGTAQVRAVAPGSVTLTISVSSELKVSLSATVAAAPVVPAASASSTDTTDAALSDAGDAATIPDAQVGDASTTPRTDADAPISDAAFPADATTPDEGDATLSQIPDAQSQEGGSL
jgi:hypothetical protein